MENHIGLFSGSFNPPHAGHLSLMMSAYARQRYDVIWMLPVPKSPQKKSIPQASFEQKIEMCRLLTTRESSLVKVREDFADMKPTYKSFAMSWLRFTQQLAQDYPSTKFSIISGQDQSLIGKVAANLIAIRKITSNSANIDSIAAINLILNQILSTPGANPSKMYSDCRSKVSSKSIRRSLRGNEQSNSSGLTPEVHQYILRTGLYK